jgi:O-antigen/teichoic acid export membrane protein
MKSQTEKLLERLKMVKEEYTVLIKNTSWMTLNQIVTVVLSMFISIIFARFTSQELFGNYNFLISIITMISIIAIPGLNTSMLRSISRGMDGVYVKAVKLSFMWSMLGVPTLFLIGAYFYLFNNQIIGIGLFIAAIFFPLIYAPNNWIALLQGKKRFDIFAKYSIIQTIIRTLAITLTIFLENTSLIIIFTMYIITTALTNIFFYFKCKKYLENNNEEKGWKKSGYKLSLNDFISLSYDNIDKILIGIFLGPVELAIYTIAVSIVSAMKGSAIQIIKVISPSIFTMKKETLGYKLKKTFPVLVVSNLIITAVIILCLPFIMELLYSEKYASSILFAQIYSLTIPLAVFLGVLSASLIAMKEENALLSSRILGFSLMMILYTILIPLLGINGAIIASILYYASLCLLQFYCLKSSFHRD